MRSIFHLVLFLILVIPASAQKSMKTRLIALNGEKVELAHFLGKADVGVVVFYSPECPLCKNYTLPLNELKAANPDLPVIAIYSGTDYSDSVIHAFNEKYQVTFVSARDRKYKLAKRLNAGVTPEAFLLSSDGNVVYSGLIDNRVIELGGNHRREITEFYLKDALLSWLAGEQIALERTEPKGCFLYAK
jgi:protein-disulfide isomerase